MDAISLNTTEQDSRRPVITGMGVCSPLGNDLDSFGAAVLDGRDAIDRITTFDADKFESQLAGAFQDDTGLNVSERDKSWMDRCAWYTLHALKEALQRADFDPDAMAPERISVALGTSHSGLVRTEDVAQAIVDKRLEDSDPRHALATLISHVSAVVCHATGARGERVTISSACASSNNALGVAADLIRDGRADVVISGGADTVSLCVMAGFNSLRAHSPEKNAPFSTPVGLNVGEGAGVVVVESLAHAQRRGATPVAEILGYGLSGDAHHITAPDDTGDGAERCMREALWQANMAPSMIDYISAHGTGTEANDAAEAKACLRVFGSDVPVSSSKSFLGHTLGASGILEILVTLLCAERNLIAPTMNFRGPRPGCPELDFVPNVAREGAVRTFICNNYGFGGNNSSVVLTRDVAKYEVRPIESHDVAITGVGVVSALGHDADTVFNALLEGRSALQLSNEHEAWVGLTPKLAFTDPDFKLFRRSSPMIKFAIHSTAEAIGGDRDLIRGNSQAGLILGINNSAQKSTEKYLESVFVDDPSLASAHHFPMTTMNAAGGQTSIIFKVKGYTTTVCGGFSGIHYSHDLLAQGRQDIMLTGGSDEATPTLTEVLKHVNLATAEKASVFGTDGFGVNFGEAGASLKLERVEHAAGRGARILARILGTAQGQDAGLNLCRPDGRGLADVIRTALGRSRAEASDIEAIVAFGVGSRHTVMAEGRAVAAVFGEQAPPITALTGAAGYAPSALPALTLGMAAQAVSRGVMFGCVGAAADVPGILREPVALSAGARVLVIGTDPTGVHSATVLAR
ncbi:beta-ketoacyl-[acyl-carrier-protein] synthase family protein [Fodinicurvata sp. EGI_FJ10296]|uniref:beta-ketoacyl-[acyl-carrier-protein] synthase family protein n=1 Tax=Fodinicurvata sp. EGI_FJ10296 TaxID=3231908 RepID=UPI00345569BD